MRAALLNQIEMLRQQMIREANIQGSLSADKVVAISQELDKYLVLYQKSARNKENKKLRFSYNWYGKVTSASGIRQ